MTPDQYQAERKRLLAHKPNIAAAADEARAETGRFEAEVRDLWKQVRAARYEYATEGKSEERAERIAKLDERIAAIPAKRARLEAAADAAADARRRNEVQIEQLLEDGMMSTFQPAAREIAAHAESQLRSLAAALREAQAQWQTASGEWLQLRRAQLNMLERRDREAGIARDAGWYQRAVRQPAFPCDLAALAAVCRPAAADLLLKPAKPDAPREMERVA